MSRMIIEDSATGESVIETRPAWRYDHRACRLGMPVLTGSALILGLTAACSAAFLTENFLNLRRLSRVRHRIHVNGSRGKSSVTRLIAGALRAAGVRTMAKTTGSSPRLILPDGSEVLIRRLGPPTIKEQMRFWRWVARFEPEAAVIECMALQPGNQWVSEHRMIRATIGVCTNVRADHLDVMGPTVEDVEKALAGTVPVRGVFVTAESRFQAVLRRACGDRGTRFEPVTPGDVASVSPQDLAGFSYIEHAENVAIALKVAEIMGIDRPTAIEGMRRSTPDVGVLRRIELDFFGRRLVWVNAFAANDPDSYRIVYDRLRQDRDRAQTRIVVVNCREDRPDRSRQLGVLASQWRDVTRFILVGTGTEVFARAASHAGLTGEALYTMVGDPIDKIFERVVSWSGHTGLILGIGNIKGVGALLDEYFRNRAIFPVLPVWPSERSPGNRDGDA